MQINNRCTSSALAILTGKVETNQNDMERESQQTLPKVNKSLSNSYLNTCKILSIYVRIIYNQVQQNGAQVLKGSLWIY